MQRTRVVNIKYEEYDVYIGRAMPGLGLARSYFANDYRIGIDGTREEVIEKYRRDKENDPEFRRELEKLRGKRIGCFCKLKNKSLPQPLCHGDVLVEWLEGPEPPPESPAQGVLF